MKLTTKIILGISIIAGSLTGMFLSQELEKQIFIYQAGNSFCGRLGSKPLTGELRQIAELALEAMDVPGRQFVQIYEAEKISCAAGWQLWLKEQKLGPTEFVIFHEVAHMKLGHFASRALGLVTTPEQQKAREVEADLLAAQILFELGRSDIIIERIKQLKRAVDNNCPLVDTVKHPSLQENYTYLVEFAKSKGIQYETNN